jgi:hypothetical protein
MLRHLVALGAAAAICAAACGQTAPQPLDDWFDAAHGSGSTSGGNPGSGGNGSGGYPGTPEFPPSSGGAMPVPMGGSPSWGEGGAPGRVSSEGVAWLESQGEECEPASAMATELPSTPESNCDFLQIGLPGVLEYTVDPTGFNLDRDGQGGMYYYLGCDELHSPCAGRLAYDWEVAYLADNEWSVSITPVRQGCQYEHVLLHELPTGELSPRATVAWAPVELTVHLQPTAAGLRIGAVRSATDELLAPDAMTTLQFNGGWPEDEIRGLFVDAFVAHLQSLEWECLH